MGSSQPRGEAVTGPSQASGEKSLEAVRTILRHRENTPAYAQEVLAMHFDPSCITKRLHPARLRGGKREPGDGRPSPAGTAPTRPGDQEATPRWSSPCASATAASPSPEARRAVPRPAGARNPPRLAWYNTVGYQVSAASRTISRDTLLRAQYGQGAEARSMSAPPRGARTGAGRARGPARPWERRFLQAQRKASSRRRINSAPHPAQRP